MRPGPRKQVGIRDADGLSAHLCVNIATGGTMAAIGHELRRSALKRSNGGARRPLRPSAAPRPWRASPTTPRSSQARVVENDGAPQMPTLYLLTRLPVVSLGHTTGAPGYVVVDGFGSGVAAGDRAL
jgi:hypothetical protein